MLKTLLNKQIKEIFRSYFYNPKTGRARSRATTIGYIVFFIVLMAAIFGGIFGYLAFTLCGAFHEAGMDWLYYLLFSMITLAMGVFGSVFNTFTGLYLSKDNDFLISLPIPVRTIMLSRLLSVYLMGLIYGGSVFLPAYLVYLFVGSHSIGAIVGGPVLLLILSLFIWILSCILGFVVAKISQKIKRKSFITVLASLLFIALYYFVYFKAQTAISALVENLSAIGGSFKGKAIVLYWLGQVGTGAPLPILGYVVFTIALVFLTWMLLQKTFIDITTSVSAGEPVKIADFGHVRTPFRALYHKELKRYTSSALYILNSSLGLLMALVLAVASLIKRNDILFILLLLFSGDTNQAPVLFVSLVCLIISMVYIVVPSVSLEGNNLWIARSIPVDSRQILKAKLWLQLSITYPFTLICGLLCTFIPFPAFTDRIIVFLVPQVFLFFWTVFGLMLSLRHANVHWTNEVTPIKQSSGILIALLSGMGFVAAGACLYLFLLYKYLSAFVYSLLICLVLIGAALWLLKWCMNRGCHKFETLS